MWLARQQLSTLNFQLKAGCKKELPVQKCAGGFF
jgi:hypothetical protein